MQHSSSPRVPLNATVIIIRFITSQTSHKYGSQREHHEHLRPRRRAKASHNPVVAYKTTTSWLQIRQLAASILSRVCPPLSSLFSVFCYHFAGQYCRQNVAQGYGGSKILDRFRAVFLVNCLPSGPLYLRGVLGRLAMAYIQDIYPVYARCSSLHALLLATHVPSVIAAAECLEIHQCV